MWPGNGMSAQMGIRFYLESSVCVGREDARRETVVGQHRFFLYLRTLNWVRTRQRQIDLLKKMWGRVQPRTWPRPIALPICTAQDCDSNRLPIQVQALLR